MKIISFNINSIRARIHQLAEIINQYSPDIIGLQETKVADEMFPVEKLAAFNYHLNYFGQKGHYGVALLTKQKPLAVRKGFPTDENEAQRRIIMVDMATPKGTLTVINGYFPQGESDSHPIKYPVKRKFYADLTNYIKHYHNATDLVAIIGDMNITPTDADIGLTPENQRRWLLSGKCSFLPEERRWMNTLLNLGFSDTFRTHHPACNDKFSWFDYRSKGLDNNIGLRLDLILASNTLAAHCQQSDIDYAIRKMEKPSDHAPVWADFALI